MHNFTIPRFELNDAFQPLAREFKATWKICYLEDKMRVAILVSKYTHAIQELLWRYSLGEFNIEIPLVISNHPDLKEFTNQQGIEYYHFPIQKENKNEQEKKELLILKEKNIDTIVLARYMQILSSEFVSHYPNRIINIHHSFLPAFVGGNPYKQAFQRGVKLIGATSHYVTEDLDEGPIIEQDTARISHKDTVHDLIRKGRDLERLVLARALHYHSEHRILVQGRKTIVFS
jgi:formyltetrahydrofolate deformylase